MHRRMRSSIGRTARRGVAVAVLGWLTALGASVLVAPTASAAPTATVEVKDLTPPLVSIDPGGTVTFVNRIEDKTVQVGGGLLPSLVTVVVHTDVALTLPSGQHPLKPGEQWQERFDRSCLTCAITYTYRAEVPGTSLVGAVLNTVTGQALARLPQNQLVTYDGKQTTVTLGVPTPFVVNTLVPLPNLPSLNLPQLPAVTVPAPPAALPQPPVPGGAPVAPPADGGAPVPPVPTGAVAGVGGPTYAYGTTAAGAQLAPTGAAAGSVFDAERFAVPGRGAVGMGSGSGGVAGGPDGSATPGYVQLAGLAGGGPGAGGPAVAPEASSTPAAPLEGPALLAVLALAGACSVLLHTVRARRAAR